VSELEKLFLALDEHQEDALLSAIADAHEEEGREFASGWRWLASRGKKPFRTDKGWIWGDGLANEELIALCWVLPANLFKKAHSIVGRYGGQPYASEAHLVFTRVSDACKCLAEAVTGAS
jgi:hypothetical protein